jgi:hypothetical protein
MRLFAKVAGIDLEKNSLCTTELEQTIDRGDGGAGLPAPVAMCTRARGLFNASDFSNTVTALIWQSRRLRSGSAGFCIVLTIW